MMSDAMSTTTRGTNNLKQNFTVTGYLLDVIHAHKDKGYSERIILEALATAKGGQAWGKAAHAQVFGQDRRATLHEGLPPRDERTIRAEQSQAQAALRQHVLGQEARGQPEAQGQSSDR